MIFKFSSQKWLLLFYTETAEAYQKVAKSLQWLLDIFRTGGQKLQEFFDGIWEAIAKWFLKNKKIDDLIDKVKQKIKKYLKKPRFPIYKTTKMLKKYIGEETGYGWCAPSVVVYLGEVERLEYELAIIDGKNYTKNGKIFDTAFAGEGKFITQKAIFVMSKDGNIYATNTPQRFYFHHSTFLAGGEIAAAGEIKFTKGIIEFVSKQSGHYKPSVNYMKQFMRELEKNGIDVNNIIVEF